MGHLIDGTRRAHRRRRPRRRPVAWRGQGRAARRGRAGGTRIGVAVARFNEDITLQLLDGARAALEARRRPTSCEVWVPGAFELPLAAQHLLAAGCDAVVALGCVIRGDTGHYDFVAGECASGLQRVQLDTGKPGRVRRAHHGEPRAGSGARRGRPDE